MSQERFVALGVAPPRTAWFSEVARWATSSLLPVEFVKCLSVDEAHARITSGRRFSALLVDDRLPRIDRELVAEARRHGCPTLLVTTGRAGRHDLGEVAALSADFGHEDLLRALTDHAAPVDSAEAPPQLIPRPAAPPTGILVAVIGHGGVGTSTAAMALAQGLADRPGTSDDVLLADLALAADQGVLHGAVDPGPGLPELVDAHRAAALDPGAVVSLSHAPPDQRYQLLLGLRRHRDWTALRAGPVDAALDGLLRTWDLVVADLEGDLEGESVSGSFDIEDRNLLARLVTARAHLVIAVGLPTVLGLHHLALLLGALLDHGVDPVRIVPVLNRSERGPRRRADAASSLASLVGRHVGAASLASPVFVAERRGLDTLQLGAGRAPATIAQPLTAAAVGMLALLDAPPARPTGDPTPVERGSLGAWSASA